MNNGKEVISWIHSLLPFGIKPGLKRMEWMLERLDHPERKIKTVHIGGTNGKGSTVSFMRHVLEEAGYSVGTFTSPYIECFEERISFKNKPIKEEDLIACAKIIRPLVEQLAKTELGSPTEFEVITTIAFYYFATMAKPDLTLIEVGLGGRFDSTNVINPLISIITSIGLDHMHILGGTIEQITTEKAGIIKQETPIISGVAQAEAREIIAQTAEANHAEYEQLRVHFHERLISANEHNQVFLYSSEKGEEYTCTLEMRGPHQRENAAVAIQALKMLVNKYGFTIHDEAIVRGLSKTSWPGRFEQISNYPLVIVDGAHNEQGMKSLAQTLDEHYPHKRFHFLIAATEEKDMRRLLAPFEHMDASFTFTSFSFFRAAKALNLYNQAEVSNKRCESNWETAIELLQSEIEDQDQEVLVICGSLYFISEVRAKWKSYQFEQ